MVTEIVTCRELPFLFGVFHNSITAFNSHRNLDMYSCQLTCISQRCYYELTGIAGSGKLIGGSECWPLTVVGKVDGAAAPNPIHFYRNSSSLCTVSSILDF